MIIDLRHFIETERKIWDELAQRLQRLENDPHTALSVADAERIYYLYERTSSALVRITTFAAEPSLVLFLQSLVARAYTELNEVRSHDRNFSLVRWFFVTFPVTFRRYRRYFLFALILTISGAAFGGLALAFDPEAKPALLGAFPHLLGDPNERVHEEETKEGSQSLAGEHTTFSAMLMTHNTRVAIGFLALGMTWAIGTMILLFYNGVILGAVILDYARAGQSVFLAGWLLPHGVIEIPATLIAAQAGLLLGQALIGWRSSESIGQRLRSIGGALVTLICGAGLMLIWAGIIESFLSQYHQPVVPYAAKIGFGLTELLVLIAFLGFSGRSRQDEKITPRRKGLRLEDRSSRQDAKTQW
jgi:uncharacterized membrane protein SpoIIM required for sporulation